MATENSDRWPHVKQILGEALDRPAEERPDFVAAACQGDSDLFREVASLLSSADQVDDLLEDPPLRLLAPSPSLPEGHRIGTYEIVRELGRGGMGTVYLAKRADAEYRKQVAIKLVKRGMDSDEVLRRFRQERQILAQLEHPHIARLLDGGTTEDGLSFLVMEYVDGQPIDTYCRDARLPLAARLALFRTVCAAVQFAHQNLVVHRDLKPANILVPEDGPEKGQAKLLDFGIAKLLDPALAQATRLGVQPMTPEYASPEQRSGGPITTASDVYALGGLLHLLLDDPEIPPSDELDTVIAKARHEDPLRRYSSAEQLSEDIRRFLEGMPVHARPDSKAYRARKFVARHRWSVAAASLVLLLILCFSITVTVLYRQAKRSQGRAESVSRFLEELFASADPNQARGTMPTARDLLDSGVKKIGQELNQEPEVRAALLTTMGRSYRNLGLFPEAQKLLQEALRLRQQTLGNDHLLVAESLHNLALVHMNLRQNDLAKPLIEKAIAIQRQQGVTSDPEYAKGLNNLAGLTEAHNLSEAEKLYREALERKRKLYPGDHSDIATGLNNLARILFVRGDLAAAEPLYREALAMRLRLLGQKPHPDIARSVGNLGILLEAQRRIKEAEELDRQALAMNRLLHPKAHPELAGSLNNLAHLLQRKGQIRQAEALYQEALTMSASFPPTSGTRPVVLRNWGSLLLDRGDAAAAEPILREALERFRTGGALPWQTADAQSLLGSCLIQLGRRAEGEPLLRQGLEGLRKSDRRGESAPALREAEERQRILG